MTFLSAMRLSLALGASALVLVTAGPAAAQMYPGEDVTVNPNAVGAPYYPGGLLPPGADSRQLPPVHLHPPKSHRRSRAAPHHSQAKARRKPAAQSARAAPAPAAPAEKSPSPTATSDIPFSLGGRSAPAAQPARPQKATIKPPPKAVASARPLPKVTPPKGLTKQAAVLFDTGSSALSDNSTSRLNDLAFSLKTALANGADHIELIAYAGTPGDKTSESRRLSLKRALAVRQALIVDGVPANRIDVRALGGVTDDGPTDRVDIFVKA